MIADLFPKHWCAKVLEPLSLVLDLNTKPISSGNLVHFLLFLDARRGFSSNANMSTVQPAPVKKPGTGRKAPVALSHVQSLLKSAKDVLRKFGNTSKALSKRIWRGKVNEEKKIVIKSGLKRPLIRCSVHLLAVSATTTLAYFNLAGYFIGANMQGLTGGIYQALDTLCLQVTAKLLVLASPSDDLP